MNLSSSPSLLKTSLIKHLLLGVAMAPLLIANSAIAKTGDVSVVKNSDVAASIIEITEGDGEMLVISEPVALNDQIIVPDQPVAAISEADVSDAEANKAKAIALEEAEEAKAQEKLDAKKPKTKKKTKTSSKKKPAKKAKKKASKTTKASKAIAKSVAPKPVVADTKGKLVNDVYQPANSLANQTASGEPITIDKPLQNALAATYASNPALRAQRESFEGTVEQVPQALAGALPTVTAQYERGRRRSRAASDWNYSNAETQQLSVSQPLFRGGATYANTKAARRVVDAAYYQLIGVEQQTMLRAIQAYTSVVQAEATVGLAQKNLSVLSRQQEAASQRFEVGEDTRTDVSQSQARVALSNAELINRKAELASARAVYREVIGELPVSVAPVQSLPTLPASLDKFIERALQTNPQILVAENSKKSNDHVVDSRIGNLLPSVDLRGTMSRQEGAGVFGTTEFDQDQVVIAANLPLYSGGARHSQVRQAKQRYQQSRFELMDTENAVRRQAISAWENWLAATAVIDSNQTAINAAEVALDGVRQEQQFGSRTTLDVLDAERELFNAQVQLVVAERNRVVAAYDILAVMGDLTAQKLGLKIDFYDAQDYYDDTQYQFIGF